MAHPGSSNPVPLSTNFLQHPGIIFPANGGFLMDFPESLIAPG